jgi:hypothetical protein
MLALRVCINNLRWFADAPNTTSIQFTNCINMALMIKEYDLACELASRWESLGPDISTLLHYQILIERNSGNYPKAFRLITDLLTKKTRDPWALEQRGKTITVINQLTDLLRNKAP